ncbi:hypothetical protein [Mucilaginibacter sp.]|jgi:hypothetical protein|uniref:hypothetical protein n=1 Tax=Mucilaginibacter sp. TaxID=1882438 RepID=UPI003569560F
MKKLVLSVSFLFIATQLFAQKVEVTVQAISGLYHYSGASTTGSSSINGGSDNSLNYTNNPYGNKNGFSYGGAVQAQIIVRHGFIVGLGAAYEILKSKVDIVSYNMYNANAALINTSPITVTGRTYLQSNYINLNPYIGYRMNAGYFKLDILPGVDVGIKTETREHGKATYTEGTVYTDRSRPDKDVDLRLRIGLAATYNRIGIIASYAHGLTNFQDGMIGGVGPYEARSELMRLGISYRLF